MRKAFIDQDCSAILQEGTPKLPSTLHCTSTPHFKRLQWPDVSAIAYSNSTNEESIGEVLEELNALSLKDLYSGDSRLESSVPECFSPQFEKAELHKSRYSRVLSRVKRCPFKQSQ
jgi:hypothetical protein